MNEMDMIRDRLRLSDQSRTVQNSRNFAHFICFNIFLIIATTHFDIALPQNPLYTAVPKGASIRFLGAS